MSDAQRLHHWQIYGKAHELSQNTLVLDHHLGNTNLTLIGCLEALSQEARRHHLFDYVQNVYVHKNYRAAFFKRSSIIEENLYAVGNIIFLDARLRLKCLVFCLA